ncbi:MAG: FHA domain-containing protein, partial [Acidobacteriota bacterium]
MPRLILYPGLPNERIIELTKATMTIGRATENDIFILDRSLSRKHARLDVAEGAVTLSDLKSTNGVEVNGARVQSVKLAIGDAIRVGDIPILFVEDPKIVKEYVPEATRLTIEELLAENTDDIDISALPAMVREATQRARDKLRILLKVSEILSS